MRRMTLAVLGLVALGVGIAFAADVGGTIAGTVTTKGFKDVENVVVYVENLKTPPPEAARYELDQINKVFVPFVVAMPAGAELVLKNGDDLFHNVHAYRGKETVFNWGMPLKGMELKKRIDEPGELLILCDKHPEMEAWVKVVPNRYFTKPAKDGTFELDAVPAGELRVTAWHPRAKKPVTKTVVVSDGGAVKVDFVLEK